VSKVVRAQRPKEGFEPFRTDKSLVGWPGGYVLVPDAENKVFEIMEQQ
jgi:hypothetical protein